MFQLDTNTYKHSPPKNEVEKQLHLEGNKHQIIIKYKVPNAVIFTLCQTWLCYKKVMLQYLTCFGFQQIQINENSI